VTTLTIGMITSAHRWTSGTNGGLLVDPEDYTVSTWWHVGAGIPMSVYHGRAMLIAVPTDATEEGIREWIEVHRSELTELCDLYEGSEWDGNNHIGRWSQSAGSHDEVELLHRSALEDIPCYWSAADWLHDDSPDRLAQEIEKNGGVRAAAEAIVRVAADYPAILDLDEVVTYLEAAI